MYMGDGDLSIEGDDVSKNYNDFSIGNDFFFSLENDDFSIESDNFSMELTISLLKSAP